MKGQGFSTALYVALIGGVGGLVWGLALDVSITAAMLVGVIIGAALGASVAWLANAASRDSARQGGDLQANEAMFVSGGVIGSLSVMLIGAGLVVWLLRLVI